MARLTEQEWEALRRVRARESMTRAGYSPGKQKRGRSASSPWNSSGSRRRKFSALRRERAELEAAEAASVTFEVAEGAQAPVWQGDGPGGTARNLAVEELRASAVV